MILTKRRETTINARVERRRRKDRSIEPVHSKRSVPHHRKHNHRLVPEDVSVEQLLQVSRCLPKSSKGGGFFGRLLWKFRPRGRLDIGLKTKVGYGLYIGHGGPVVINETARIGNNCNLSQFTTIGSNHGQAAIIGDNVYIGPSVCLVEDVHIGSNATIGAGSVVTKDIPENATAAGNYAKVLNYRNPGRYIKNPWPINGGE